MNCENVQGVIVTKDKLELSCPVADAPSKDTEGHSGSWKFALMREYDVDTNTYESQHNQTLE
jgi:hypothetical protein